MWLSSLVPVGFLLVTKHLPYQYFHRLIVLGLCALDFAIESFSVLHSHGPELGLASMNTYSIVLIVFITCTFAGVFSTIRSKVLVSLLGLIAIIVSFVFVALYGISSLYNTPYAVIQVVILILSISYFYKVFDETAIPNLLNDLFFWVSSALLVYHGTTFFISIFQTSVRAEVNQLWWYSWQIQMYTSILYNLILASGVWLARQRS